MYINILVIAVEPPSYGNRNVKSILNMHIIIILNLT